MVGLRRCTAVTSAGTSCHATPLRDQDLCFWHAPEHAQDAAEARRLGGLRRRREATVAGAYEVEGLENVSDLRRVLEIAVYDALGLENSIPRARTLVAIVQTGARLLEVGELEGRLESLEAAVRPRLHAVRARR